VELHISEVSVQLSVSNLLVVSVSRLSEEQLLYDPFYDFSIPNQSSNAVSSSASPGVKVRFFGVNIGVS
jgi:hypothetical protein